MDITGEIDVLKEAERIKKKLLSRQTVAIILKKQAGALIGTLNKYMGGDENRRMIFGYLFGGSVLVPIHTAELTSDQLYQLWSWVGAWKDEDEWRVSATFEHEVAILTSACLYLYAHATPEQRGDSENEPGMFAPVVGLIGEGKGIITRIFTETSGSVSSSLQSPPKHSTIKPTQDYSVKF